MLPGGVTQKRGAKARELGQAAPGCAAVTLQGLDTPQEKQLGPSVLRGGRDGWTLSFVPWLLPPSGMLGRVGCCFHAGALGRAGA